MPRAADRLVAELRGRVADERVLSAVRDVPRDLFVPEDLRADAWANEPLPIGCGQTISQPLVAARMCELLELDGSERVLDVGTGSGYHAALLARLAAEVPVDAYGVGSSLLRGSNDFTADVVMVEGRPGGKVGRELRANPRLSRVS